MLKQLEAVKCDHKVGPGDVSSIDTLQTQLGVAKKQQNSVLLEAKMKISLMEDASKVQDKQIEELNAEIMFLKTKLRGA